MKTFSSIAGFVKHLAVLQAQEKLALQKGLEKCATAIEKTARDELGHYQGQADDFAAWPALAPATLAAHNRLGVGDAPLAGAGDLAASIGHAVDGLNAKVGSTSPVMVYQELGTARMPPRPVLGPAAIRNKTFIRDTLRRATVEGLLYGSGEKAGGK